MPLTLSSTPIERIQFFNGQRLLASDLQDLEQFNRAMRCLHNLTLHQAGVGSGYAVTGNKGDSQIIVQPGYAIDSRGQEIVLTNTTALQVPPVANDGRGNAVYYDLVVSYPADSDLKETETRDGIYVSRAAVRLREAPVFCWAELVPTSDPTGSPSALSADRKAKLAALNQDIESGNRIRLARAEVLNCQLNQPLSVAERRNARPALQPFISAGNTAALANTWTATPTPLGITVSLSVDTSAAQFRSAPRYFANVVGDRSVQITINAVTSTLLLDGFVRVDSPAVTGFTMSLLIPAILIDRNLDLTKIAAALPAALKNWYVVWMGVES
ncbi:MAG TPA: hypothetical protein VHA14_05410 [Bryobacteraceae bacterium]|nr:hypothetical protein [Bryobacteraceae bacterium]